MSRRSGRIGRVAAALAFVLVPLVMHAAPAGAAGTVSLRLSTTASPTVSVGGEIFASANLLGAAATPSGSMTFNAYGPDSTTCSSPIFTSTVAVAGTFVTSAHFTPAHAGTYRWTSTYSGNASYAAAGPSSCTDSAAAVIVDKARTHIETVAGPSAPTAIHGTATLSGGLNPTGTITFILTGPDDGFCSNPLFTSTVPVNGNASYDSGTFAPVRSGKYTWRAAYNGDGDNLGASYTSCLDSGASQMVTVPPPTATQKVPYSVWNQPAATPLDGVGAWMATANNPTAAAGQVAPQYLYGHSFRFADSPASGVVGLATAGSGKLAVFSATGPDGTVYNTGIAFNWVAGGFYFPLVYRAAPGVWGASIYDYTAGTWTPIGVLNLPPNWGKLAPSTTTIAIWYGSAAPSCSAYPGADVFFSPPVGYIGSTATTAGSATTATTPGDCPADTSVAAGVWAHYRLGT